VGELFIVDNLVDVYRRSLVHPSFLVPEDDGFEMEDRIIRVYARFFLDPLERCLSQSFLDGQVALLGRRGQRRILFGIQLRLGYLTLHVESHVIAHQGYM